MSGAPTKGKSARLIPANDNPSRNKTLGVEVRIPDNLVIQRIEVEVFAELLDSLLPAANDNEEWPQ